MLYLIRFLFFFLVAFVLIAAAIHAFRKRRKDLHKRQYVEFSIIKEWYSRYQWWLFDMCVFFALVCLLLAVAQAVKLFSILL